MPVAMSSESVRSLSRLQCIDDRRCEIRGVPYQPTKLAVVQHSVGHCLVNCLLHQGRIAGGGDVPQGSGDRGQWNSVVLFTVLVRQRCDVHHDARLSATKRAWHGEVNASGHGI